MPDEIIVHVEPPLPDVNVTVEPPLPEIRVIFSEVGLVGPIGPVGPPAELDDVIEQIQAVLTPVPSLRSRYNNAKAG